MSTKDLLAKEFHLRVFDESYDRIYKCLRMIEDENLWEAPNQNIPAIGNLILHICGNARQWVLSGIGNKIDNRKRDEEFLIHRNIKKSDLVFLLENLKVQLKDTLKNMPESKLEENLNIQGFETTGFSAIVHVIEHFSYHTGQITTLTKLLLNKDTGYYTHLNLNQLNNLN